MLSVVRKIAIIATASTASLAFVAPAHAAITVCASAGCVQPSSNVLFNPGQTGTTITSTLNNSPALVRFNGLEVLRSTDSQGQARITGNVDNNLQFLEILLDAGGTFNEIEFNLNALADGTAVLNFFGAGGNLLNVGQTNFSIDSSGQNFFAAFNEAIGRVTISTNVQLSDVRQIRIGGIAAPVPEPGTWAMMLLGFGVIGAGMRRNRRSASLPQMA